MAEITYRFEDETPAPANAKQVTYQFEDEMPKPSFFDLRPQGTILKSITNIPKDTYDVVKGLYNIVRHPIKTANALYDIGAGGIQTAADFYFPGKFGAETPQKEAFSQATTPIWESISNPAGIPDRVSNYLENKPVSALMNLSGGLMLGGKATGVNALAEAGRVLNSTRVPGALLSKVLPGEKTAYNIYEQALKVPPSVKGSVRDRAIKTGLEGEILVSEKGLGKLQGNIDQINRQIADAIDNMKQTKNVTSEVGTIDMKEVVKRIDDLKKFYQNLPPEVSKEYIAPLSEMQRKYASAGVITPAEAQKMKQTLYALNRKHYGELSSTITEGNKAIARGLKEELVKQHPELSTLNATDSDLINLEKYLERAVNRIGNREALNLSDIMISGTGVVAGEPASGLAIAALHKIIKSPSVQSRIAIMINKANKTAAKVPGKKSQFIRDAAMYSPVVGNILERENANKSILERID